MSEVDRCFCTIGNYDLMGKIIIIDGHKACANCKGIIRKINNV